MGAEAEEVRPQARPAAPWQEFIPSPSIAPSGVTAGSYNFANIAVNVEGRVTSATSGTPPVLNVSLNGAVHHRSGNVSIIQDNVDWNGLKRL